MVELGGATMAYAAGGSVFLLALIKLASSVLRNVVKDRTGDDVNRVASKQLTDLQKENEHLREENNKLKEDWRLLVKEEARLSARIMNLEAQVAALRNLVIVAASKDGRLTEDMISALIPSGNIGDNDDYEGSVTEISGWDIRPMVRTPR